MSAAMADCRAPVISELDETLRSLTPQGVTKILKAEYTLTKNGKAAFLRDVWARGVGQPESTLRRARGSSLLQGRQRQTCGLAPAPRALRPVRCGQRCLLGAISDPPPYHTATAPLRLPGRACQPRVLDGQQQHLILEMLLGGVGCIIKNKNKNSIFFSFFSSIYQGNATSFTPGSSLLRCPAVVVSCAMRALTMRAAHSAGRSP